MGFEGLSQYLVAAVSALPRILVVCGAICASSATWQATRCDAEPPPSRQRPNFIVVLVDDWGWTDAACFGSDLYETPHIDALEKCSVRFTNAYAACAVCSPTRAALLTGKYPARIHLTNYIPGSRQPDGPLRGPAWTRRLELDQVTLAESLHDAGYDTAHIGKWHLAPPEPELVPEYLPDKQGFDINIGGNQWGQPGTYFDPYTRGQFVMGILPAGGKAGDYLTDRLTDETTKYIRAEKEKPFFIHLSHYAIHGPIEAKPDVRKIYEKRLKPGLAHSDPALAAMVQSVDESIGRLRATLEELGIDDRTVIVLTGDNGGVATGDGINTNAPLRAGKGHPYEGGIRVPLLIYAPGVRNARAVCKEPVITMDLFSTILDIAGVQPPSSQDSPLDGLSLVPLLREPKATLRREALYWHFPHYHAAAPYGAIRSGPWKLIEHYENDHTELFNLNEDIGESKDLSAERSAKAAQLRGMLHTWRRAVGAQMPTRVPNERASEKPAP